MKAYASLLPSQGVIVGTLAALAIGLLGSWVGEALALRFGDPVLRDYVAVSAAFVLGAFGGAFGRGVIGLAALWLGVIVAATYGTGIAPPAVGPVNSFEAALIITLLGYGLGRMVDPIWGGRIA